MSETNGSHVSWRELNLALDPIKEDVAEIKSDVKAIRDSAGNTWFGPKGHSLITTAIGAAAMTLVSTAISLAVIYLS